jgi:hypothetical protein
MSTIVIAILIYHRHKPTDFISIEILCAVLGSTSVSVEELLRTKITLDVRRIITNINQNGWQQGKILSYANLSTLFQIWGDPKI